MTITRNIPQELKQLNRWVCVSDSKRPICAIDGSFASVTDKDTWSSYAEALTVLKAGKCSYLGYVFADDGIVGIDIDHSAFDEYGFATPEIMDVVNDCESYTEISKSGTGIHILVKGDLPFKGKNNRKGWEIYKSGRFFVLTGNLLTNCKLREAQDAINRTVEKHFKDETQSSNDGRSQRIWKPIWPEIKGPIIPLSPEYPIVKAGSRHISLVSYCGQMHSAGAGEEMLYEMAYEVNDAYLDPPLSKSEVDQIVASVAKYGR